MSVYTIIDQPALEQFLENYDVGTLVSFEGISEGIENTNYFVDTTQARFVLTIFEQHSFVEMQYFLRLMHHLADHGVPSADPIADKNGDYLRQYQGKPIALVQRLTGKSITNPTAQHCTQLGDAMGKLHTAGLDFDLRQKNPRGPAWNHVTANKVLPKLSASDQAMLSSELDYQGQLKNTDIPRGVVHADLFRDNALWNLDDNGDTFSGIIDFYYSCDDILLYDLAIVANDWCVNEDYSLDKTCVIALLEAYHQHRPLNDAEQSLWPAMLRAGALRFWLSRLHDMHFPRPGEIVTQHNPDQFKAIISDRIAQSDTYQSYWVS